MRKTFKKTKNFKNFKKTKNMHTPKYLNKEIKPFSR